MSRIGWEHIDDTETMQADVGLTARIYFLRIFMLAIFLLLLYRIWWVQNNRGSEFQLLANDNRLARLTEDAPRGVIFDRYGHLMAMNQPTFNVTITPIFLPRDEGARTAVFERLSILTGVPVTNTVKQATLIAEADPMTVGLYSSIARIYGESPRETLDEAGIVPRLPDSILKIVAEHSFAQFVPAVITTGIPITLAYRIEQESIFLPGVRVLEEPRRFYPDGEYTSHLVGFMGPIPNENWISQLGYERDDRVGWAGLEASMEIELAGRKGERQIEKDWTGRELNQIGVTTDPEAGLSLHLTIDMELQQMADDILASYMATNSHTERVDNITGERTFPEIEQAAVVVMNPQTGEILAMVSYPRFDNNRFATEVPVDYYLGLERNEYKPLVNHAVSGTYPPGSTFKLVPLAGALQENLVSPKRRLNAPGVIEIANKFAPNDPGRAQSFVCWLRTGHGTVDAYTGLANSCDIYFYKISGGFDQDGEYVEGLGVEGIARYGEQFGFGRVQGIELPLEAKGNLPPNRNWKAQTYGEPWSTGDDYNLGIGQGFVTATPMQVAQMAAVIANGGFLYRPSIVHHMTDEDGNVVKTDENGNIIARAHLGLDGELIVTDADGEILEGTAVRFEFDEEGNYLFQPEVVDALDVDSQYIQVVADGMKLVNTYVSRDEFYTGATYVNWLDKFGITTAGKTGTAEYCDNIAIDRGWCRFEDIQQAKVLPTHAWYVGYAPVEDPEIVVSVFIFNGGEGSRWSAPVACHVMASYFKIGQYAEGLTREEWQEAIKPANRACNSALGVNPVFEPSPEEE